MKKPIIIISGPTASGKTSASLDIHRFLKTHSIASEIVNFDSLIFYRELNIGSAKPSPQELEEVPHHLINFCSIETPLNASQFREKAVNIIDRLHDQNIVPLCVGGSAFYIRALIKGMYDSTRPTAEVIQHLKSIKDQRGLVGLRELLQLHDPESYESIHANDEYRTTRALEHYLTHQTKLSEQRKIIENNKPYDFGLPERDDWLVLNHYFTIPTNDHWPLIKKRTAQMIEDGLIDEVKEILEAGHSPELAPLQSIGYKETISYLAQGGEIQTIDQLIEAIYIATRQLAKSQKTFFKKIVPQLPHNPLMDDKKLYLNKTLEFLNSLNT